MIPKEDIKTAEELLKTDDPFESAIDKIKEDFNQKTSDEISKYLEEYLEDESCYYEIVKAVPSKNILLDQFEKINDNRNRESLLEYIPLNQIIDYVNEKRQASDLVFNSLTDIIAYTQYSDKDNDIELAMNQLNSDLNKTKMLIICKKQFFIPKIKDLYYKNQVVKATSDNNYNDEDLFAEIEVYNEHLKELSKIDDESSRAQYISKVNNNEMKQALLEKIEDRVCRQTIIDSFEKRVDPEIESLDELARTMITEFFEDRAGDKLTENMREKMQMVLSKTNVMFGDLGPGVNGEANYVTNCITISNKRKNSINKNIGFLIHEYSHMLSSFDYCYTLRENEYSVEEGMADTFSELVLNHYLDKHQDVMLDGKRIRIDKPYVSYSGYEFENAWPRTMLYGLEANGKDIDALDEYLLGEKSKFVEMIFDDELIEKTDTEGINRHTLYYSPKLDYSNIDENSIYYRRNHILPLFQIQNKLGEKADVVGVLSKGQSYFANYIAEQYFEGKKFYEIPKPEFEQFIKLLNSQVTPGDKGSAIFQIHQYKNELIDNLSDKEIKDYSFEILERIPSIFGERINAGDNLENVMTKAIEEEIRKINDGQPINVTKEKDRIIKECYDGVFIDKGDSNEFIRDSLKDFEYEVSIVLQSEKEGQYVITPNQIEQKTKDVSLTNKDNATQHVKNDGIDNVR